MKEKQCLAIDCNRCPIGFNDKCMLLFWQSYGYSCTAVPVTVEWPIGLELKPEPKH